MIAAKFVWALVGGGVNADDTSIFGRIHLLIIVHSFLINFGIYLKVLMNLV